MQLTSVGHLRLPFGRLMGLDVHVSEPCEELPISYDQRRHVAQGSRPASWMALSFELPDRAELDDLAHAWLTVINRHSTLRTVFVPGPGGESDPHLHRVNITGNAWVEHDIAAGQVVNEALNDVLNHACSPYGHPSHRLCVLDTDQSQTVIIGSDHSHVDMWSMLVIVRDLLAALNHEPPKAARGFEKHTQELRNRPAAPDEIYERWAEILATNDGAMPVFPLPLGDPGPKPARVEVRTVFDLDEHAAFSAQAREEGVSTLALTLSAMAQVTAAQAGKPLRALFPVHSRYQPKWHDSVGWFITNSVLECASPDPKAAADAVRESVKLGSWPMEKILEPWGGDIPDAPGMFAISWLDLRRLPVRVDSRGLGAQYVSANIRTDGVMIWFIVDEAGIHLRCRYPDTPEARTNVGGWLDALVRQLQHTAQLSIRGQINAGGKFRVERASRTDIPALVSLLSDDEFHLRLETTDLDAYEQAFDRAVRDNSTRIFAVRDASDEIVGMMQLTIIPGFSRSGAARLLIEALRVDPAHRNRGLGSAMVDWAHEHGRLHGATIAEVHANKVRDRAREFLTERGYEANQVGLKLAL